MTSNSLANLKFYDTFFPSETIPHNAIYLPIIDEIERNYRLWHQLRTKLTDPRLRLRAVDP